MNLKNIIVSICIVYFSTLPSLISAGQAGKVLFSHKTVTEPVVDGKSGDLQWQDIDAITTYDPLADITINLKALHTDDKLFVLVEFSDKDESRDHRMWHWQNDEQMYIEGPEREDIFIIKWAMREDTTDISLKNNNSYEADVWYWKASRTDPEGYADDKIQQYSINNGKNVQPIVTTNGQMMYLKRQGDAGKSSYKTAIFVEHKKDIMPRYTTRKPLGSRANVSCRGTWQAGKWTLEFSRALVTNEPDDVQFDQLDKHYLLGVSRYEIAGRKMDPSIEQPLFGSGEITENLHLTFK